MPLSLRLRQLAYDLRENLLFRPAVLTICFAIVATMLPLWESGPGARFSATLAASFPIEAGSAQLVLGTLAGAMMTVVSVVYSILLVALSLASIQFSTRILASFMRDRPAQNTLGMLVGTFVYTLLVLRSVRTEPPWVPLFAVYGAIGLALASLGALVWFIHHLVRGIQANHIIDRIAGEAELVLDAVFTEPLAPGEEPSAPVDTRPPPGAVPVMALRSGYVQLVSVAELVRLAGGGRLVVVRGMGQFVVAGTPLAFWLGPRPISAAELDAAFDIGTVRTMQDDAEWGLRQIVDVGLKAISPAVNDPSTGATCIDHLGRLLVRVAARATPRGVHGPAGEVVVPTTCFGDLVRLAYEQMRQYGRGDMAVSLRILRSLADLAEVVPHASGRAELLHQGRLTWEGARKAFHELDCHELDARWQRLDAIISNARPQGSP